MRRSGIVDQLTAHCGLASLPDAWLDLAYGRISTDEAAKRAREVEEEEALVRRTTRMLVPPTSARSRARLKDVLEQWSAGLDHHDESSVAPSSGRWVFGMVGLMAAAVVLVVMPRVQPGVGAFDAGYTLELDHTMAVERQLGAEQRIPRYHLDRAIQLVVRPDRGLIETVGVRVFAIPAEGLWAVVPVEADISDRGVVEVLGRPRAWGLAPGRWTLTVVVGPPPGLPDTMRDVRMDRDAPYDVMQREIEVVD